MSLEIRRRAEISTNQIAGLEQALSAFYKIPPANYYSIADRAAQQYTPREQPFHCDLVGRVFPGAKLLEAGCGTAHLCPHVEKGGGIYTGLDFSEALLQDNRRRFPRARFISIGTPLEETFDIVASLYTLEHIADPPAYLESLWRYCRPGGLIGIICPEFIDSPGFPPSVFFGTTPRRLREKLSRLAILDSVRHLMDLKVIGPCWKHRACRWPPGAFWINLKPRILHGAELFSSDADAVHFPRLKDLVWHFEQNGAAIVQTSMKMPDVNDEILRYSCYVLARKPK